uniref:Uncharacterized protein n=1 Tax=Glossina pallidipes TaxID=7398 RepID=A0A1A9ZA64_GLOPL
MFVVSSLHTWINDPNNEVSWICPDCKVRDINVYNSNSHTKRGFRETSKHLEMLNNDFYKYHSPFKDMRIDEGIKELLDMYLTVMSSAEASASEQLTLLKVGVSHLNSNHTLSEHQFRPFRISDGSSVEPTILELLISYSVSIGRSSSDWLCVVKNCSHHYNCGLTVPHGLPLTVEPVQVAEYPKAAFISRLAAITSITDIKKYVGSKCLEAGAI